MLPIKEKNFLTYLEYKLFCYLNNKKPLSKDETGCFIKKDTLDGLWKTENSFFSDNDIKEFINVLCKDKKLSFEKIREMSIKIGFDESELLPLFNIIGNMSVEEDQFKDFLNSFC